MDTIQEVEDFRETFGPQLRLLLKTVRGVFDYIRDHDARAHDKIRDIYGRADKQDGEDFKSSVKIAGKLALWRQTDAKTKVMDIHDIVGLTIVVYYADHIDQLIKIALPALAEKNIVLYVGHGENPSYHRDFGYHAIHLILISRHTSHENLKIEVQFKTMLHDAWGAKTHDLTYKPKGIVNQKIKRLMESLGDSLQAIEVQSENLRAMIAEQSVVDADRKRVVITAMAEGLQRRFPDESGQARRIFEAIKADMQHLSSCSLDDEKLVQMKKAIADNKEIVGEIGPAKLLLNIWLACIRLSDDHYHVAQVSIDAIQSNIRATNVGHSYLWGSMLNYYTQNFEQAIKLSRLGLKAADNDAVTRDKHLNNLCYFLVESCLEAPLDLEARKQEAATLRKELEAADLSDAVRPMANFTRGFYDIVFGENEDQILDGIGQCEEAYRVEHKTPDAFVDLLIKDCRRAGWRRILYLDTTKKAEAVSGA